MDVRGVLHPLLLLWGLLGLDFRMLRIFTHETRLSTYPLSLGMANYESLLRIPASFRELESFKTDVGLGNAIRALSIRANLRCGNPEERWFSTLKLGEIHSRLLNNWTAAVTHFNKALVLNSSRSDPFYFMGERHQLIGKFRIALKYQLRAAAMPTPSHSARFVQSTFYECLVHLELIRVVLHPSIKKLTGEEFEVIENSLLQIQEHCPAVLSNEVRHFLAKFDTIESDKTILPKSKPSAREGTAKASVEADEGFPSWIRASDPAEYNERTVQTYQSSLSQYRVQHDFSRRDPSMHGAFDDRPVWDLLAFIIDEVLDKVASLQTLYADSIVSRTTASAGTWFHRMDLLETFATTIFEIMRVIAKRDRTCATFQPAYSAYIHFLQNYNALLVGALKGYPGLVQKWKEHNLHLKTLCL